MDGDDDDDDVVDDSDVGDGWCIMFRGGARCCNRRINLLVIFKKSNQFGLLVLVLVIFVAVLDGLLIPVLLERFVYHNRSEKNS